MNKLALITVNYNNYAVTQDFLQSLLKQSSKNNFRVFIADLSDTPENLKISSEIGAVIKSANKGYAHGVNIGVKKAIEEGYDKFCVINNDTEVSDNFVAAVLDSLQKHERGLVGGKIYYASGFEYHRDRYNSKELGKVLWYAGGIMDWDNVMTKHRGVDEVDSGKYDKEEETEFVTGCLVCFDRSVWERVGEWDESYFLYFEDADWGERARRRGVKLYYDPTIVIWHKNAQSTGGAGSKLHENYQKKNRLKFGLRYAPWKTKLHLLKNYFTY